MKAFINRIKRLIPSKRKLIQLYCALLFNANLKGFVSGNIYQGDTKKMCVPGINCYSCPGAVGACPLGSLQGSFSADRSTLYYVGGILLLYSIFFGRMICGWFCPFGLIQDLVYKIKTPKLKKNKVTRVLSYLKYVILVFFVFIVPIMYAFRDTPLPAFCKYICPAGTLEGGIGLLSNKVNESYFSMLGPLFTWKFLLLVSIIVACIFIFRMFCRFVCPLGALYGLFNRISVFGVKVENHKCINCGLCVNHCKADIRKVGDQECIQCGECISHCPTNAIVWKGPKLFKSKAATPGDTIKEHKTARTVTRALTAVLLIAFLVTAVVFYWNDQKPLPEVGCEVGYLCPAAELNTVDENGIGDPVDPTSKEKITIINFWGTWCTPCVNELPYFDRIATEYKDEVSVIAIHTNMVSDTAEGYLAEHYPKSDITFAIDLEGESYYNQLGGRGTYPYTVVLDEDGVITDIFVSSLEYEDLKEVVERLLNE